MIGKLISAEIGRRMAGPGQGLKGVLIGVAVPWMLRRAFTPIGVAVIGAYGAKKLYDHRRVRQESNNSSRPRG